MSKDGSNLVSVEEPVGIVLDKETFDALLKITKSEKVSKCEFIRNALREAIDRYQGKED